jgi:chromate reductase
MVPREAIILAMTTIKIAGFAGSLRKGSFNQKLLERGLQGARDAGAEVDLVDLGAFDLPIFHGDLTGSEEFPAAVRALKQRLEPAHGFLIASPEYNSSVTPLLKNVIDWCSVASSKETPEHCFKGKFAGLLTTSPGRLGGIRGLVHLRDILMNVGTHTISQQYAVPGAHEAFSEDGSLSDPRMDETLLGVGRELVRVTSALQAAD